MDKYCQENACVPSDCDSFYIKLITREKKKKKSEFDVNAYFIYA